MSSSELIHDFHQSISLKFPYVKSENWEKLERISIVQSLQKNEKLFHSETPLDYGVFVADGWLKLFYIDEKGNERISGFCTKNEYIDNWNDIHQQSPLPYSISALTAATVIKYPLQKMVDTFKNEPDLLQLCIDLSQEMIRKKREHYEILTLKSPLDRYMYVLENRKYWLQNISLTDLAKYLHISRETLSRVRNDQLTK
ncbi:Crp/Fnr family transcriptional regulator [Sinomicrobium weinanense]|uniref:Crp/Fnr family transcriptional regulator n=1 Tax=Sinomicrobium weinanense TaxID=2842200 RepID=A0A926JP15_9FLAO|nr:Crp/Fnr family transcriptional regulator [Sinomicrobium weinanense]MBC9794684.1 Crp/Fnr family transcriptional regulator [Sinomicrobium weinanense]MBU3124169.1 Crp/Fnr family transcriptional regulator [Sinomicrobium weinanense]